jgi:hypothetical protein
MENSSLESNLELSYSPTVDWKKVLMYASFGAAVYFLISGKRAAGMAAAGVGLATVASEYPEKFQQFWEQAPEYLERGHRIVNAAQNLLERVAEQGQTIQSIRHGFRQGSEYRNGGLR